MLGIVECDTIERDTDQLNPNFKLQLCTMPCDFEFGGVYRLTMGSLEPEITLTGNKSRQIGSQNGYGNFRPPGAGTGTGTVETSRELYRWGFLASHRKKCYIHEWANGKGGGQQCDKTRVLDGIVPNRPSKIPKSILQGDPQRGSSLQMHFCVVLLMVWVGRGGLRRGSEHNQQQMSPLDDHKSIL